MGAGGMRWTFTNTERRGSTGDPNRNYSRHYLAQEPPHLGTEPKRSYKWWIRPLKGRMTQPGAQSMQQGPKRERLKVPKHLSLQVRLGTASAVGRLGVRRSHAAGTGVGRHGKVLVEVGSSVGREDDKHDREEANTCYVGGVFVEDTAVITWYW